MARLVRRRLFAVAILAFAPAALLLAPVRGASAGSSGPGSKGSSSIADAVRQVIQSQLDAFARNDAVQAFYFAAPRIRAQFASPKRFMDMVRAGYPMIFRATSVEYLAVRLVGGQVIQPVRVIDDEGRLWLAEYAMTKLSDDTWKITGVQTQATGSNLI